MNTFVIKWLLFILLIFFWACKEKEEVKIKLKNIFVSSGVACWYGIGFEGKKTVSGDVFRKSKLTAAHRMLEFGTLIRVTNNENLKSVVVVINDRGPFVKGKMLDLSEKAAKEIDLYKKGFGKVGIEICGYDQISFETLFKHYKNIQSINKQRLRLYK